MPEAHGRHRPSSDGRGRWLAALMAAYTPALQAACGQERGDATPVAVAEAHGTVSVDLAVVGMDPNDREVTVQTLTRRFQALRSERVISAVIRPSVDSLRLNLKVRIAPDCSRAVGLALAETLTTIATARGALGVHILPSSSTGPGVLSRLRGQAGADVTLEARRDNPFIYTVRGAMGRLHEARQRLHGWSPTAGLSVIAGPMDDAQTTVYLIRSRPDLESDAVAELEQADKGLYLNLTPAGRDRLREWLHGNPPPVGLVRLDDRVLQATPLSSHDPDRLHLLANALPGGPAALRAILDQPPLPQALRLTARRVTCQDRMGAIAWSVSSASGP